MFKQILNTFFTKILSGIFNLVIVIIISNYLGADGKGLQGIVLTTISVIVIITGIIGPGGLTYLLPRIPFPLLIIPSYIWAFIMVVLMWVGLLLINIIPNEYILHVVLLSLISSVRGINNSILHAKKKIQKVNFVSIFQIIITLLVIIYLIIYKEILSVESYVIGLYFGFGVSMLISFVYTWKEYINSSYIFPFYKYLIGIKKHFKYGGYNQLDVLAQVLSFRLAYYFLNYYADTSQVGIYSNAVSIIESVWIISRSIAYVQHSRIVNSRDKSYSSYLTLDFIKLSGFFAFMAIVVLVFIPAEFYQFVFGNEFGDMRMAILALSPGILFFSISFIISSYFSGTGKHYINSISSIVGLIVIVLSSLILIPLYGIVGAGLAASLSYFSTTMIKIINFCKIAEVTTKQMIPTISDISKIKKILLNGN